MTHVNKFLFHFQFRRQDLSRCIRVRIAVSLPQVLCSSFSVGCPHLQSFHHSFVGLCSNRYTFIVKTAVATARLASETFKNLWPHDLLYVWKILGFIGNAVTQGALETVLAQADMHDGLVDGAELEAVYENTKTMLDAQAAIYDEVVCRCAEEPRRGHGCDGVDNDCDKTVDECDEDIFPPIIDVSDAVHNCGSGSGRENWFDSNQAALDCVNAYTTVDDDCDSSVNLGASFVTGTGEEATIGFEETLDRCGNDALSSSAAWRPDH